MLGESEIIATTPAESPVGGRSTTRAAHGSVTVEGNAVERALAATSKRAASWRDRSLPADDTTPHSLLEAPDVGPTCEVLLADQLFHDLSATERGGLLAFVRASQDRDTGAWNGPDGLPDLSLTTLGWWALVQHGEQPGSEHLVRAARAVHALGGAQRSAFNVRLWLAMGGFIPWSWLPAILSELWLLPSSAPLSPARISPWARGMLTPYLLIARAPMHLQLADPSTLLLLRTDGTPVAPRLTRPGLAGDLLQAFDTTVKLARKLPRGPMLEVAIERARRWIDDAQQSHGGWFSFRPTLLSLLALRVMGASFDDPRIRRGLTHLRSSRGRLVLPDGREVLAQGLHASPLASAARLLECEPSDPRMGWLLRQEVTSTGPWQLRADTPAGGFPSEPGAHDHLDLEATCRVLDALECIPVGSAHRDPAWAAARRAIDVLLAMQQGAGGFARFERGEAEPPMRRLPWTDADLLAYGSPDDEPHVRLTARAVARLGVTGFRLDDDRIARAIRWLQSHAVPGLTDHSLETVVALARCAATVCPEQHELRIAVDRRLRSRQGEDGGFGSTVDTARALRGLVDLESPCVQARRAAARLCQSVLHGELEDQPSLRDGLGLSPTIVELGASAAEAHLALRRFAERGGTV